MTCPNEAFPTIAKKQRRGSRLIIDEDGFCKWLGEASPNEAVEYFEGFLALDVAPHAGRLSELDRSELIRVARRAYWAMEQGFVHLLQRRNNTDDYTYIAVRRHRQLTFGRAGAYRALVDDEGLS